MNQLLSSTQQSALHLEAQVIANLKERIASTTALTEAEVAKISSLKHRLFPDDFSLSLEESERLRALCRLSRCSLKPSSEIRSHRKLIGPLIVLLKRLSWPFVRAQLKDTFDAQEEFNLLLIETLAKEIAARKSSPMQ